MLSARDLWVIRCARHIPPTGPVAGVDSLATPHPKIFVYFLDLSEADKLGYFALVDAGKSRV